MRKLTQTAFLVIIINLKFIFHAVHSKYYCNLSRGDPCTLAEYLYEPYARTRNCQYDGVYAPCDHYITPGWYKSDELVLDQCPTLNSCGTVYPVWMNGSRPQVADGVVSRTLCKTGFEGCCVRQYDLQIKNCGTSYVYCLPALDSCPERLCFGLNGTCEYPAFEKTTKGSKDKVPLKEYKDLQHRYVTTISVVVPLVLMMIGVTTFFTVCFIRKRKKETEISQSRGELVVNEKIHNSQTPVESIRGSFSQHSPKDSKHNNW